MIHVVTEANKLLYKQQLEQVHRLRWNYYIESRDWRALRELQATPGLESDQYDDPDAVYLISVGGDGGVGGSLRLRRADKGTLLFDLFPQLVQGSRVDLESPDVWEITRVIRTPSNRSRGPVKTSLHAAMLEFALTRGARTFVGVCDTFMLPGILSIWKKGFRPLGLPTPYAEGEMIAVRFDVDLETLEQARASGERQTCTMFELPPPASKKSNPLLEAAILAAARDLTTDGVFELLAQLKDHSRSVLPLAS